MHVRIGKLQTTVWPGMMLSWSCKISQRFLFHGFSLSILTDSGLTTTIVFDSPVADQYLMCSHTSMIGPGNDWKARIWLGAFAEDRQTLRLLLFRKYWYQYHDHKCSLKTRNCSDLQWLALNENEGLSRAEQRLTWGTNHNYNVHWHRWNVLGLPREKPRETRRKAIQEKA
jgi:hypothetical protein